MARISAILSLMLATGVFASGPAAVPTGAAPSAPRAPAATSGTPLTVALKAAPIPTDSTPGPGLAKAGEPLAPAAPVPPAPSIGPGLDAQLNAILQTYSGYQLGVALIDMADGAVHEYGARGKFTAASTGKILAAAAYYRLAETGQLSLDTPIGDSDAGVQIRQMIQQSDNDSWALILDTIGLDQVRDYAASLGVDYDPEYNMLTPAEMARTLSLLYTGQLLTAVDTAQLLSYMQNTNLESLIPAALPSDVAVFHKYGLLNSNVHDASILTRGDKAYAFVVYTLGDDGSDMDEQTVIIHELTRAVAATLF